VDWIFGIRNIENSVFLHEITGQIRNRKPEVMKYERLTKEQLDELHEEFATFLATQSIDKDMWMKIVVDNPTLAEEQLDLFSDMIWERVLEKVTYLENIAPNYLFLFHIGEEAMHTIIIQILDKNIDVTTKEGFMWLKDNMLSDSVQIRRGSKQFGEDRLQDVFALIRKGAEISKGILYRAIEESLVS